eukprot:403375625
MSIQLNTGSLSQKQGILYDKQKLSTLSASTADSSSSVNSCSINIDKEEKQFFHSRLARIQKEKTFQNNQISEQRLCPPQNFTSYARLGKSSNLKDKKFVLQFKKSQIQFNECALSMKQDQLLPSISNKAVRRQNQLQNLGMEFQHILKDNYLEVQNPTYLQPAYGTAQNQNNVELMKCKSRQLLISNQGNQPKVQLEQSRTPQVDFINQQTSISSSTNKKYRGLIGKSSIQLTNSTSTQKLQIAPMAPMQIIHRNCSSLKTQINQQICQSHDLLSIPKIQKADFLRGHKIKPNHRERMIDWMIQVLRVFNIQSAEAFFLSVSLMDRFLEAKQKLQICIQKSEVYEIGLVCIYIASKIDNSDHIYIEDLIEQAGHNKFSKKDIINKEIDILQTLQFKIIEESLYSKSMKLFYQLQSQNSFSQLNEVDLQTVRDFILFNCQLCLHSYDLARENQEFLASSIVKFALHYLFKKYITKIHEKQQLMQGKQSVIMTQLQQSANQINHTKKSKNLHQAFTLTFKSQNILSGLQTEHIGIKQFKNILKLQVKEVKRQVLVYYNNNDSKNLAINFPLFLTPIQIEMISKSIKNQ